MTSTPPTPVHPPPDSPFHPPRHPPLRPPHHPLSAAVRAVSSVTLLSRVGGMVRDIIIGRVFGDTAVASAFAAGFAIPNMFRRLFGEGALSAAFIPEYTAAEKEARTGPNPPAGPHPPAGPQPTAGTPNAADRFASLVVARLAIATGLLTAAVEAALLLVLLLAPHDHERELSLRLVMVMLPFMPAICVVAILGGMLQVHGKFGRSASGPIILNGFIIAVGAYYMVRRETAGEATAYAMGLATVLSGLTQALYFFRLLRPYARWSLPAAGDPDAHARAGRMMARFVPVAIGLGALQLNTFMDTLIAMWPIWFGPTLAGRPYPLDTASNGILSLTARLYQFPLGVFGIAVATAAFPMLARHADEPAAFASTLRRGVRLSLFIGLPATLGLILIRHDLVAVMFRGEATGFSEEGVARSSSVLLGFAPAVWAYSLNHVLTRAFYAKGDTKTPMRLSIRMVALNFALNCILIWPLREAGLAWATSTAAVVQCLVLARLTRRLLSDPTQDGPGQTPPLLDAETRAGIARIALISFGMAAATVAALWAAPGAHRWSAHLGRLALGTAVGGVSFIALARLAGVPELRDLLRRA